MNMWMKWMRAGRSTVFVMLVLICGSLSLMVVAHAGALTDVRDTPARNGDAVYIGVKTNTIIYAGGMTAIDSTGYLVPASDASGLVVLGRAAYTVDNRTGASGAGDSGAKLGIVERGIYRWDNVTGISDADIGSFAYVVDDQSVDDGPTTYGIIAGVIVDVDSDGVWVDTYNVARSAGSYTTLAASGNSTIGGTLGVTGATTLSGNAAVGGTLGVTGIATLSSNVVVAGTMSVAKAATFATSATAPVLGLSTGGVSIGYFAIINGTNLSFVTSAGVTNAIDADIGN